jgi:hypothetical protein
MGFRSLHFAAVRVASTVAHIAAGRRGWFFYKILYLLIYEKSIGYY